VVSLEPFAEAGHYRVDFNTRDVGHSIGTARLQSDGTYLVNAGPTSLGAVTLPSSVVWLCLAHYTNSPEYKRILALGRAAADRAQTL
jgi:hypothetical protein